MVGGGRALNLYEKGRGDFPWAIRLFLFCPETKHIFKTPHSRRIATSKTCKRAKDRAFNPSTNAMTTEFHIVLCELGFDKIERRIPQAPNLHCNLVFNATTTHFPMTRSTSAGKSYSNSSSLYFWNAPTLCISQIKKYIRNSCTMFMSVLVFANLELCA